MYRSPSVHLPEAKPVVDAPSKTTHLSLTQAPQATHHPPNPSSLHNHTSKPTQRSSSTQFTPSPPPSPPPSSPSPTPSPPASPSPSPPHPHRQISALPTSSPPSSPASPPAPTLLPHPVPLQPLAYSPQTVSRADTKPAKAALHDSLHPSLIGVAGLATQPTSLASR